MLNLFSTYAVNLHLPLLSKISPPLVLKLGPDAYTYLLVLSEDGITFETAVLSNVDFLRSPCLLQYVQILRSH